MQLTTAPKTFKDEKYIYLLMAYQLAKSNGGRATIGHDNSHAGGFHFLRTFHIQEYNGKTLLIETKGSKNFADYSRAFEVSEASFRPYIREYFNEDGENCSTRWEH